MKIKFAIIGCGRISQRHAQHINELAHLAAVCDIKVERAQWLADKYNCNFYESIDVLLGKEVELDIVSICTPNGLHAEHAIKALKAGKHVLCEKPMAIRVQDCERMILEAEKANRKLFIVKQNRYNPPVVALKKVIDEGKLGRILNIQVNCFWNRNREYYLNSDWKGKKDLDGGTLFTQFSHFIDLLYWLIGDVKEISVLTRNFLHHNLIEFEDTGVIILEFDKGAIGTIHYTVNSYEKNMEGSITIFGEKGTIKVGGQYLNTLEYYNIEDYLIDELEQSRPPNEYGTYQGSMSNHDKVYENVLDVINNSGAIATSGLEGLKTVQIIERIYAKAKINNV